MGRWEEGGKDECKSPKEQECGGTCLYSQHSGGREKHLSESSRPACATERVSGQAPKLHKETCFENPYKTKNKAKGPKMVRGLGVDPGKDGSWTLVVSEAGTDRSLLQEASVWRGQRTLVVQEKPVEDEEVD